MVVRFKDWVWAGQCLERVEWRVWMSRSSMQRTRNFGRAIFSCGVSISRIVEIEEQIQLP